MNVRGSVNNSRFVFRLLAVYILFQFFWWAFHIIQLHGDIRDLEIALNRADAELANAFYRQKVIMVLGEGLVFVALLIFGLWRMNSYLRREAELARQERNFMLSVTHELKTPVAGLRLYLETLRNRPQLDEERKGKLVQSALGETNRLDHLVENILLSTRFELEDMAHLERIDLSALIATVVAKLQQTIGAKHITQCSVQHGIAFIGDSGLLESLVTNLYDNAVKYSPEGSRIEVGLRLENGRIELWVADSGQGIPEEETKRIFKKFYRIGNEETRRSKGTGLGLYLVERITKLHGGHIGIEPKSPGSKFILTFTELTHPSNHE